MARVPSYLARPPRAPSGPLASLVPALTLFDATMLVMGGIIGAGIFMNPAVVARLVPVPALMLGVWLVGGLIALVGAFIYAELAALRPDVGGQYAYLRDAYHPLVAFLYGWALLLVIQSGGMAAVAVTFAHHALVLVPLPVDARTLAVLALAGLTALNCLGVRVGGRLQSVLMVLKLLAIGGMMMAGLVGPRDRRELQDLGIGSVSLGALGAAMVPVLFAYGGWQTSSFVAGEIRDAERALPRALLAGVSGVVVLYVAVNAVSLAVLSPAALAATATPASAVMGRAFGAAGERFIALGIAVSTLGFLSQSILTAPRVYFAMARDGVFFPALARLHPRSRVPIAAIVLQGAVASLIASSGRYEQILNYVVSMDWVFFGLTGASLFVFRRRAARAAPFATPGHPMTTGLFVLASAAVATHTIVRFPAETLVGVALVGVGIPVYGVWRRWGRGRPGVPQEPRESDG